MVDQVLGNCQTVIKNLGRFYRHVQVVSGATILGNGTVALILDPERLVQDAVRERRTAERGRPARPATRRRSGTAVWTLLPLQGIGSAGPSASAQSIARLTS